MYKSCRIKMCQPLIIRSGKGRINSSRMSGGYDIDNLMVYHDKYYRLVDLMGFNKRFFTGNNWRLTRRRIKLDNLYQDNLKPHELRELSHYFNYDYELPGIYDRCFQRIYPKKIYIAIEWCKENIPDPKNDFYCYW